MDLTPFLASTGHGTPEEGLESILSCPRLTPRDYQVLDLQSLNVHNRLQAVLKGLRCLRLGTSLPLTRGSILTVLPAREPFLCL